ncbi:hypothetical protein B0H14DRAFT_3062513 [Mycena olivaceomarginata]|nr:hypothetical protein B0H14DRAFT_3062513 [Mycena olivaceomarginata]
MLSSVLVIVPFLSGVFSANDWNTPCVNGECSYDLPTTNGPSGTLKIWGSENAITDITPAAHWQILGCNQTTLSQNIRLVCMNDDPSSLCGHLDQNTGAVNKIVRLPENCGANAFARVSKFWVPDDQSIPSLIKTRLIRRDGNPPVVKALAIDTNFDAVDWSKVGKVNFAIHATSVPGAATDIQIPGSPRADKTFQIEPVTLNKSANLFNTSVNCGSTSASLSVDIDANVTAQPALTVSVEGTFIPPRLSKFDVVTGMTAQVSGALTVSAELTGHVDSGVIPLLNVGIPGMLTSHDFNCLLSSLLLPCILGFDFPEILTIGPSFQLNAQFVGDVQLSMDLSVGINFDVNNAQLIFPPNSATPDSSAFSIGDTPLSLSAAPGVQATGTLTAHLIPSLNLGVTAFGSKANANIFLALDTSAELVLNLDASAQINSTQSVGTDSRTISLVPTSTQSIGTDSTTISRVPTSTQSVGTDSAIIPPVLYPTQSVDNDSTTSVTASSVDGCATTDTSTPVESDTAVVAYIKRDHPTVTESFGGCVQVNGGINVNAGAQGDFFGEISIHPSLTPLTQNPKKCFGDGASIGPALTKRWMRRTVSARLQRRFPFSCPIPGLSALESVADEEVSSSSTTEV